MPMMERDARILEREDQIKALHRWCESQNINRLDWGLLFGAAAGLEVHEHITNNGGSPAERKMGLTIIAGMMDTYSLVGFMK